MKLSEAIKKARVASGMTQAEVAKALGYSNVHNSPVVSRWENEKSGITATSFFKLVDIIAIPGEWLSANEWQDEEGEVHTFHHNASKKVGRAVEPDMDALIAMYAEEAGRIYTERTAGDYTWEGFLTTFLREAKAI